MRILFKRKKIPTRIRPKKPMEAPYYPPKFSLLNFRFSKKTNRNLLFASGVGLGLLFYEHPLFISAREGLKSFSSNFIPKGKAFNGNDNSNHSPEFDWVFPSYFTNTLDLLKSTLKDNLPDIYWNNRTCRNISNFINEKFEITKMSKNLSENIDSNQNFIEGEQNLKEDSILLTNFKAAFLISQLSFGLSEKNFGICLYNSQRVFMKLEGFLNFFVNLPKTEFVVSGRTKILDLVDQIFETAYYRSQSYSVSFKAFISHISELFWNFEELKEHLIRGYNKIEYKTIQKMADNFMVDVNDRIKILISCQALFYDVFEVFRDVGGPSFRLSAPDFKPNIKSSFVETFEDHNVSKAASYFLERTFKEKFVIDDILQILLACVKDETFIDEAKVLGKIIVQDAANDKAIGDELTQLFSRIFQTDVIRTEANDLVKYIFYQEETKQTLIHLFVNAFQDERIQASISKTLGASITDISKDKEIRENLTAFIRAITFPLFFDKQVQALVKEADRSAANNKSRESDEPTAMLFDMRNLQKSKEKAKDLKKSEKSPSQLRVTEDTKAEVKMENIKEVLGGLNLDEQSKKMLKRKGPDSTHADA
jgi:hypothetical protein